MVILQLILVNFLNSSSGVCFSKQGAYPFVFKEKFSEKTGIPLLTGSVT